MTREEAIKHLNTIGIYYSQDHSDPYGECARLTKDELGAICLAIKALEQQPCNTDTCKVVKAYMNGWDKPNNSDAISRTGAIKALKAYFSDEGRMETGYGAYWHHVHVIDVLKALPPVTLNPCGDAIDRAEAIRVASGYCHFSNIAKELAKLPPVKVEPKIEMIEQWQELKETIIEMRDNDGTATQQEACKFLANLMDILEKQMQEVEK